MIWWEDFSIGDHAELGRQTFGEEEIAAFARRFDRRPFPFQGWGLFGRKD